MAQIQPFQLEPEYSSDEDIPNHEEEEEEDVLVSEMNSCRLKNTSWCLCGHCTDMPSQKECLCCKELKNIAEGKLTLNYRDKPEVNYRLYEFFMS